MDTNFEFRPDGYKAVRNASASGNPFASFWMAGFECSDKINAFGARVDLATVTGHLQCIYKDYENLSLFKMKTVREGIRWSHVEKRPYEYDWSTVAFMIAAAKEKNIQQVWDLCHFGFPDDLTPLHPMFARRFAALCRAFVKFYRSVDPDGVLIVTPINEVSFLSWLGGDVRGTSPFCIGQGWEVKYRLMKAYIEGVAALKEMDPGIRILTTEPLINIAADIDASPEQRSEAKQRNDEQFQVTDILSGRMCPELNGRPEYLDILGYNYYYNNQWVHHTHEFLEWKQETYDPRFVPLHLLLAEAYQRYKCPIVLAETSHPKEDRPLWIQMIGKECELLIKSKIPLWGVCWYPVLDRPDWDNLHDWHQSGIWDGVCTDEAFPRDLNIHLAAALWNVQMTLSEVIMKRDHRFSFTEM